jgi:predicted nucleic acid-binding protein
MKYLVDSDWVADYLVGKEPAVQLLKTLAQDGVGISLITFGEIYEGIYYGRDPKRAEAVFREFLRGVDVVPLNRRILQRFARIRGALRRHGQLIGDPDILIGATALYHDLDLVTRNTRDFARIPGLRFYEPS